MGRPLLNIVNINNPNENISLYVPQYPFICTSGAETQTYKSDALKFNPFWAVNAPLVEYVAHRRVRELLELYKTLQR